MIIKRIRVDGGFLNGLDLSFDSALNAIIGPRGSGKTSIIELIRYCLNVSPIVPRASGVAVRQALSVLDDGKVTIVLDFAGEELTISRTAGFDPIVSAPFPEPVVLGATEIERIGIEPSSRLSLLDAFLTSIDNASQEQRLVADLSALSAQIQPIVSDIEELRAESERNPDLDDLLIRAKHEQEQLLRNVPSLDAERAKLKELGAASSKLSEQRAEADRLESAVARQSEALRVISPIADSSIRNDRLLPPLREAQAAQFAITSALNHLDQARALIQVEREKIEAEMQPLIESARPLRAKLNEHVSGLGTVTARIQQLEQLVIHRATARERTKELEQEMAQLRESREVLLARLESARNERFMARQRVAADLSRKLGPRLRVTVMRAGALDAYETELADLLRGSGLHKSLFGQIAEKVSPRDLIGFVEHNDAAGLRSIVGINQERARKIVDFLRIRDYSSLLILDVEDEVRFWLLDGTDYKSSEEVSMGQRCTMVLPILMEQLDVPLILDQPEDHLDNAFIVETLIWTMQQRKKVDQLIIATHNPNIPVLGNAEQVALLGSDGKTGFVRNIGRVTDSPIVDAIVAVMEGGQEAFDRRAEFYHQHGITSEA